MAVTYGFFNSLSGDRTYNADQMSEYFEGIVSNGVYENVGGALQVLASSGMTVNVQTGRALVDCKWVKNDAILALEVTAAHATLSRYTAVVLRLDYTNRLIEITTKDGTAATTPTKPTMTDTSSVKELCLAYIYVGAGVTAITQAKITDMRASSLCGWVTGVIEQVDTATLWAQWQDAYQAFYDDMASEFQTWFDNLTAQLNINTYIKEFSKTVTMSGTSEAIALDMTNYAYDSGDIIFVFVNGLHDTSYTLDTTTATPTITPTGYESGTVVEIRILKSKIGFYVMSDSSNYVIVTDSDEAIVE